MKSPFSRFFGSGDKEIAMDIDTAMDININPLVSEGNHQEIIEQVKIESIKPNKYQPRTIFSEAKIEELARTIHIHGVIQPIVIRKIDDAYEIIAGERRYRAMKKLGWTEVPAIIRELDDKETASIALIENLQREELTAIEEAFAYEKLIELHSLTQEALAQRLGKGQSTVANKLRLLKLPEEIKTAILTKELSERHARALIPLKESELQLKLYKEVIDQHLNVKQLETRIQQLLNPEEAKEKRKAPRRKSVSKDVRIAVNTIRQSLVLVTKSGIDVKTEEVDSEDFYTITVRIPKKK